MKSSKKDEVSPHILANKLQKEAIRFSKNNQYKESYDLFVQSSKIWKELGNIRRSELMMANALASKANLIRKRGNYKDYREYLLKTAKKWKDLGLVNNEMWCLASYNESMAYTMRQRNNLVEERKYEMKAYEIWNNLGIIKNALRCKARFNESMANTMKENNDFVEERKYEMKAYEIWNNLGIIKNALRCKANYNVSIALEKYLENDIQSAINYYEKTKNIYSDMDDRISVIWCEAKIDYLTASVMTDYYEFFEASNLKFQASEKLKSVGIIPESLKYEAHAWSDLATYYKRNKNYDESIPCFKKSSKIYSQLENIASSNWCMGNISECLYLKSKFNGSLKIIVEHLKDAIDLFEKSNDITAANILRGDLYKYEGFYFKSIGNFEEALNKFISSNENYNRAYLTLFSVKSSILQKESVLYTQAMIKNTTADIEFITNIKPKLAALHYKEASELFELCKDELSVRYCNNLYYLCKALDCALEGNYEEAINFWSRVSNIYDKLITKPFPRKFNHTKMIDLISTFTKLIVKKSDEDMKKLIHKDKGPSFETRIRELISKFDGRTYEDVKGDVFNCKKNYMLVLHKYGDITELELTPEQDEIGIVFEDNTPINIDIFGKRIIKNRSYIIVCECKHRPNYNINIKDVKLFNKKIKFVEIRYNKIEKLSGRQKLQIENKWYFSTGNYTKQAITYSTKNNIKLINKNGINKLFKEFGIKRL